MLNITPLAITAAVAAVLPFTVATFDSTGNNSSQVQGSVPSTQSTLIGSGTTIPPVAESTEWTSLTTYTTVTSCPVTTTKVQNGTTSIIVETSLITSTITTCPRCSEKTKSVSAPDLSSSTPGSPGQIGTTTAHSPSNASSSSPSIPLPTLTTYTSTKVVSTLTTTFCKATTFSLSSSGKVYSATAVRPCAPFFDLY